MTYLSAISFLNKVHGFPDLASSFIITKFMAGIRNSSPTSRRLQPITKNVLQALLNNVPFTVTQDYDKALLSAMYSLMYHACLRIGEVAKSGHTQNTLTIRQVLLGPSHQTLTIQFLKYKHSQGKTPSLTFNALTEPYCPVALVRQYLTYRGMAQGPLFVHSDGTTVCREWFTRLLKVNLALAGLDTRVFNTHSFRIGRCTQLVLDKYPDSYIQKLGRWSSTAYRKYVRPSTLYFS